MPAVAMFVRLRTKYMYSNEYFIWIALIQQFSGRMVLLYQRKCCVFPQRFVPRPSEANLKTLPKITQIKEISAWVSHFPRHTLIPVQNDSVLSSLTGSTLPISSKYQNGLKLDRILPAFWILMNGISVDEDYIFFGYIIPTFKNSINNISNANIFFH